MMVAIMEELVMGHLKFVEGVEPDFRAWNNIIEAKAREEAERATIGAMFLAGEHGRLDRHGPGSRMVWQILAGG